MPTDPIREMRAFREYLDAQIERGEATATLDDCIDEWRAARMATSDSIEAVLEGLSQAKAGQGRPFREVLAELQSTGRSGETA
ncbi:MAG: hypothetical protein KDA93_17660 [Planctomycetaceae bacterium]|nr:hypothetical protein [Planctomycetaceae bacterium]